MKTADQFECVCLSFTKPLEDSGGCWQISLTHTHKHTQSTDIVDVAKLSPAALTAGNKEEAETEGAREAGRGEGKEEREGGRMKS